MFRMWVDEKPLDSVRAGLDVGARCLGTLDVLEHETIQIDNPPLSLDNVAVADFIASNTWPDV